MGVVRLVLMHRGLLVVGLGLIVVAALLVLVVGSGRGATSPASTTTPPDSSPYTSHLTITFDHR